MTLKTLTGLTFEEAVDRFKQVLPPRAYKVVPGFGAELTDINPAYLTEVATDVFGPCGIGWFYDYDSSALVYQKETKTSSKGKTYTQWSANITKLNLFYVYINETGETQTSLPIVSNGGSDNESLSYAIRGALTNALGAAFAKLLWQIWVYQGLLSHNNAVAMYERYSKVKGSKFSEDEKNAPEEEVKYVNVETEYDDTTESVVETKATTKKSTPSETKQTVVSTELLASKVIIPEGIKVPLAGRTLLEASENKNYGMAIVGFLAGELENGSKEKFEPANDEQLNLQKAAKELIATGKVVIKKK